MNWMWVGVMTVFFISGFELLRWRKTRLGLFLGERLKTFSARLTVAFLISFTLVLPFCQIGVGLVQRLVLIGLLVALVAANFIHLENKEA